MLSDALRQMRERVRAGGMPDDTAGFMLALRAFEMEARNMEERIELVSGRPHVALDGRLIASPIIDLSSNHAGALS